MRKSWLYIIGIIALLSSCNSEDFPSTGTAQAQLTLSIDVEEYREETRASLTEVDELHLFVFDESGIWLTHQVVPVRGRSTFHFPLESSDEARILHFALVSRGAIDYTEIAQEKWMGKDEGEVITAIESNQLMYWKRVELPHLKGKNNLGNIALLRNQAKVSVYNNTPNNNKFELLGFVVHNTPEQGTLAPFNALKGKFEEGNITVSHRSLYHQLAPMDENDQLLVPESAVGFLPPTAALNLFERQSSSADNKLYLLLKAKYRSKIGYYKVGFHDAEKLNRIPIQRNVHYQFMINEVTASGFSDLQTAINNPPAENATLSVLLEEYTKISDGANALEVSKTAFIYHETDQEMKVSYKYTPSSRNPAIVEPRIELLQERGKEALNPTSFSFKNQVNPRTGEQWGEIYARTSRNKSKLTTHVAEVRVQFGNLVRTIRVELGPKKKLEANLISHGFNADDEVEIHFNLPAEDIQNQSLYPIVFQIESKYLYPEHGYSKNSNLSVKMQETGLYLYEYKAKSPGEHVIYFRRTMSNNSEVIRLESPYHQETDLVLPRREGTNPQLLRGLIWVEKGGVRTPLKLGPLVLVEPTTTPRSLTVYADGKYRLQVSEAQQDDKQQLRIEARYMDGVSYRGTTTYKTIAERGEIVLAPYFIKSSSEVYEYRNGYPTRLNIGRYHLQVREYPEIRFDSKVNSSGESYYDLYIPSDIPGKEEVEVYIQEAPWYRTKMRISELKVGVPVSFHWS